MAAFTTTVVEKKENVGSVAANGILGVYTRTFSYTIPAGTASGSTAEVITIPAGTVILALYDRASVTLANSATIAYSNAGGSAMAAAAVRSAATVMAKVVVTATDNTLFTTESTLRVTTGVGTIDNASTITCTIICAVIDVAPSGLSTFTV
jgi:hypothetical protein